MERLLTLSERRIERELVEWRNAVRVDRASRKHALALAARTIGAYLAGLLVIGASFASHDRAIGGYAFVAGVLASGLGPLLSLYGAWLEASS